MLFLTLSSEPLTEPTATPIDISSSDADADGLSKGIKEQIIYDLSVANEALEHEVQKLKQYVLDVRRAARQNGCESLLQEDAILTIYPEFNEEIKEFSSNSSSTGDDDEDEDDSLSSSSDSERVETVDVDDDESGEVDDHSSGDGTRHRTRKKVKTDDDEPR